MVTYCDDDTIAAIATAPGRGGIAITRISGPQALDGARRICHFTPQPRHAYFKKFYDSHETIDEGVVIYYAAPNSYTGEDIIELQGHGGLAIPQRVLNTALKIQGIRLASPGEFTRRAFLNGKLDLSAAEAVADLISASSDNAARAALSSLQGNFAKAVSVLDEQLTLFRVHLEACLDFPEEHEIFLESGEAAASLEKLQSRCRTTLQQAKLGAKQAQGLQIVIMGAPNAGKSSLLNALAQREQAIVSPLPGTTRDVLSAMIEIAGISVTLTDTAGLRSAPGDEIEKIGIARALDQATLADLIIVLIDSSVISDAQEVLSMIERHAGQGCRILLALTKCDLPEHPKISEMLHKPLSEGLECVRCTVRRENGLQELLSALCRILDLQEHECAFSARQRHCEALERTLLAVEQAAERLCENELVLCAHDISSAQQSLGEITGRVTSDDILGKIFETFCIGK